jgi:hypothetical protein
LHRLGLLSRRTNLQVQKNETARIRKIKDRMKEKDQKREQDKTDQRKKTVDLDLERQNVRD